jgi:hypothetical protein
MSVQKTVTAYQLMKRAAMAIKNHPDHYDQNTFCTVDRCGTQCCRAGWMVALTYRNPRTMELWEIEDRSFELIGLYSPDYWDFSEGSDQTKMQAHFCKLIASTAQECDNRRHDAVHGAQKTLEFAERWKHLLTKVKVTVHPTAWKRARKQSRYCAPQK